METKLEIQEVETKLTLVNQNIDQLLELRSITEKYLEALKKKYQRENATVDKDATECYPSQNKR